MARILYKKNRLRADAMGMIERANAVIAEHTKLGIDLTLRQIYYKFVKSNWIANDEKNYKKLGSALNEGRMCGLIDWDGMEDRMRNLAAYARYNSVADFIELSKYRFALDLWAGQSNYVEVWVEKDALMSVVAKACSQLRVPHFACRGYCSQSEMFAAAQRFRDKIEKEDKNHITVIHLGDHDPSGIDMSRDITDRLTGFMRGGADIDRYMRETKALVSHEYAYEHCLQPDYANKLTVKRIALTMDQVEEYDCPPNPAKTTDARFAEYERLYGDESWELDALEPMVMVDLIRKEVRRWYDDLVGEDAKADELRQRKQLQTVIDNWHEVAEHVEATYGLGDEDEDEDEDEDDD